MKARTAALSISLLMITAGVLIIVTAFRGYFRSDPSGGMVGSTGALNKSNAVHETNWDNLPEIKPLTLTERDGSKFEIEEHRGEAMLVSFFFTKCPSVCREQNSQLAQIQEAYLGEDLTLLSITCDPKTDTPVKLREYAKIFKADPERWLFLTGDFEKIKSYSIDVFQTALGENTHGTNLMLVDKWGRFRDRFDWQDPGELIRLRKVLETVLHEEEAPVDQTIETRTPAAGAPLIEGHSTTDTDVAQAGPSNNTSEKDSEYDHGDWKSEDWIKEFTLTERSGKKFSSEDMQGHVWVGSFFFSRCPSVCVQQNNKIKELIDILGERDVTFVSLTTDSEYDTPAILRRYATKYQADGEKWLFLTGDRLHIRRIASEYFGAGYMKKENHSTKLILVDKWGEPRGSFSWDKPKDLDAMRVMIDKLLAETSPPDSSSP